MRNVIVAGISGTVLLASPGAFAAEPATRFSATRRLPNIAAAQRLTEEALVKVLAARAADEYDQEGHAERTKALLEQAKAELDQAVEAVRKPKEGDPPWPH